MADITIVLVVWRLMQTQMQQLTFYEDESIVPLHKKFKFRLVYLVYDFEYNT